MGIPGKYFSKIYMKFRKWKSKDYTNVDKETKELFNVAFDNQLDLTLQQLVMCQNIIGCLKTHKIVLFDAVHPAIQLCQLFKDYNYDQYKLREDVCKAFENDDQSLTIYKILYNSLNLSQTQRQQIYEILLYKLFKVSDLKHENVVDISKTF
eukprot:447627_1